ncbi:uncharacterized protein TM35_000041140 [Trypanosoma theileri]|uniref:Uncharacterized protein n=1 Tax=Trypanosoma theileri TaxID=67003 RepID=A0A1X0P645_9TRYP|nr:uncharacterized protein TM35_000041140 [Trypanosoma theileri]ORC91900.1 hypothetical protein TM35_000041140 [Trypanosoma theileri]
MMIISEFHHFIFYNKKSLVRMWYLIVVPRLSTLYCRRKPQVNDVFLLEDPLALRLRRYTTPEPAVSYWGRNISKKVLGHVSTCYQQYHPHQVAAEWCLM